MLDERRAPRIRRPSSSRVARRHSNRGAAEHERPESLNLAVPSPAEEARASWEAPSRQARAGESLRSGARPLRISRRLHWRRPGGLSGHRLTATPDEAYARLRWAEALVREGSQSRARTLNLERSLSVFRAAGPDRRTHEGKRCSQSSAVSTAAELHRLAAAVGPVLDAAAEHGTSLPAAAITLAAIEALAPLEQIVMIGRSSGRSSRNLRTIRYGRCRVPSM